MARSIPKLRRSMAVANLFNLGFSAAEAVRLSGLWAERQGAHSGESVAALVDATPLHRQFEQEGRLYVSFHYSNYAHLYRTLGENAPHRRVYAIIGEQSDGHRKALSALTERYGFQIEFIQSGPSMIKAVRRGLKNGDPAIILLDVPWARGDAPPDLRYDTRGGCFLGRSTVARLLDLMDTQHRFLLTRRSGSDAVVQALPAAGVAEAFGLFGEALMDDPADYERLDSFHRFFEFREPRNTIVTFSSGAQRYAIHHRTMRSWAIADSKLLDAVAEADGVCREPKLRRAFVDLVKGEVDAVVSI
jgi:hypothetical protein